jgi:GPI mannosyltransferase 2
MSSKQTPSAYQKDHPLLTLSVCFVFWKVLLIAIALMSPGPGYDTSTTLLNHQSYRAFQTDSALSERLSKFVRWDAIYFTQISLRGYLFEQEWAFGWGFTQLLAFLTRGITATQQN